MTTTTMRAVHISASGEAEVLQLREVPRPVPVRGQVLIKVIAAGINRPDVYQRKGLYPPPPGVTDIPGLEVAGTVIASGPDTTGVQPGTQVCALLAGGGYAEYAVAEATHCLPVPAGWSVSEAATLPETFFTVWSNVFDRARLKAGETFLVHGGSGGIGTTAIQLAHAFGATVFATAGGAEKCRACRELGADHVFDYREDDFVSKVMDITGQHGINVILDMVMGDYLNKNICMAAEDARIVIIGGLHGFQAEADFTRVMTRRLVITGSTLRARDPAFKAAIAEKLKENVWPLLESGQIRPQLHSRFPLAQAAEAHKLMESGAHTGKIVLIVD